MAEFTLAPDAVTIAVAHRSVDELWLTVAGTGQLWRSREDEDLIVKLAPGVSVSIEVGTAFQFRNTGDEPLRIVGVTTPPWPGDGEAVDVDGRWEPSVS